VSNPPRVSLAEFLTRSDIDERAELLLGTIWAPEMDSLRHYRLTQRVRSALMAVFVEHAVFADCPLAIPDDGSPKPDVLVLAGTQNEYITGRNWDATEALLVVEVSIATLARDGYEKDRQDALGNIPQYWLVDVEAGLIEVRTDPTPRGYRHREFYVLEDTVEGILVAELLDDPQSTAE
jgi:Uma2 family endonuclease